VGNRNLSGLVATLSGVHFRDGLKSYISIIDIEIIALDIFDKRFKNIFQSADPLILPDTSQLNLI
jgi:hypothetical protein